MLDYNAASRGQILHATVDQFLRLSDKFRLHRFIVWHLMGEKLLKYCNFNQILHFG